MKLKNKKTGEIRELPDGFFCGDNLKKICEEWEDYEEPKGWCVTMYGGISRITKDDEILIPDLKEIGNYFNDKESAYDALDKLKAWKRLKDKGFMFTDYDYTTYNGKGCGQVFFNNASDNINDIKADLDLLFGGEE